MLEVRGLPVACLLLTADERRLWLTTLEGEERQRLESLNASMTVVESEKHPTAQQVSDLLVAALQAQTTLMRMSRVFPAASAGRLVDAGSVLSHPLSLALAVQLRRCWAVLGVTDSALSVILQASLTSAADRSLLPGHRDARRTRIAASEAQKRLADEGLGQCNMC